MKIGIKKLFDYFAILGLLVLIDQGSKEFFIIYFENHPTLQVEILPFLDMVYSWNSGISFGLLGNGSSSNLFFIILNTLITLYLAGLLVTNTNFFNRFSIFGLLLIIGGALGNLIDRIIKGSVFDFIYFNYQDFYFPAFNLADSFISIGALLFLLGYHKTQKSLEEKYKIR